LSALDSRRLFIWGINDFAVLLKTLAIYLLIANTLHESTEHTSNNPSSKNNTPLFTGLINWFTATNTLIVPHPARSASS